MERISQPSGSERPTGVHVNGLDPGDIAWGINLAFEDLTRLKEWGKNTRQRVLQNFTWNKAAEKTLEIYSEA
ncbi:MAG: glycosyltransferase family 1 protein, partial [Methanotrichaceae archaeon]|nr:glycosyltransferase family 1 protein [Methanotrichaceae archaeon]